jgi:predicted O-methyltransferase YrrM
MPTSEETAAVQTLRNERDLLKRERDYLRQDRDKIRLERDQLKSLQFVPPGHFYSPIPQLSEIQRDAARIFTPDGKDVPGVDLREAEQLQLLAAVAAHYPQLPFPETKVAGFRYYYQNPAYSYADGIFLYSMLRHFQPARVIEVGSGFSSCVMLDTNERFFGNRVSLTFIDPYTQVLDENLRPQDRERVTIIPKRVQDVELDLFRTLQAGDILFIDSTHVAKIGSDVNDLFFRVLPALQPGVVLHVHDVFFPFEYPQEWVFSGRAWNEDYLLRAFLQYNSAFRILLFSTFLARFHADRLQALMPLCLKNPGGNIWLEKL